MVEVTAGKRSQHYQSISCNVFVPSFKGWNTLNGLDAIRQKAGGNKLSQIHHNCGDLTRRYGYYVKFCWDQDCENQGKNSIGGVFPLGYLLLWANYFFNMWRGTICDLVGQSTLHSVLAWEAWSIFNPCSQKSSAISSWLTVIKFPPSTLSLRRIEWPRFWQLLILLVSLPDPSTLPSDTISFVLTLVSRMVVASSSKS